MKNNNKKKNIRKNIRKNVGKIKWFVYILECADKTFYTGITTDLKRRLKEHNSPKFGAKYTKPRQPVRLVYSAAFKDRSEVLKEEFKIKSLTREEKEKFIKESVAKRSLATDS